MAKYKVQVNSMENLRELLQETYRLADEQLIQSQNEINKLANSTRLQDEIMDSKAKYGKMMSDYLSIKDKAISKKLEIAKLLSEICKYNGDLTKSNEAIDNASGVFDLESIKKYIDNGYQEKSNTNNIKLKER